MTKEEFLETVPIGEYTIGHKTRFYSREEWEDFWEWSIQGREKDVNIIETMREEPNDG